MTTATAVGIAEVAQASGLSQHTLRWYEREGLVPAVARGPDGRRRYDERSVGLIRLLVHLRRSGMPTAQMRRFVTLVSEGSDTHGRRVALLDEHAERIRAQQAELAAAAAALEVKRDHYLGLIDAGLDCDGAPMSPELRPQQASRV